VNKTEEMRERAKRVADRTVTSATAPAPEGVVEQEPAAASTPKRAQPVRAAPIRITADLPPQHYRELIHYAADLAVELGRVKVPHVQVVRALVAELTGNDDLKRRIAARVQQQLDS
jgi:hypothetical protein